MWRPPQAPLASVSLGSMSAIRVLLDNPAPTGPNHEVHGCGGPTWEDCAQLLDNEPRTATPMRDTT
jgi:hypothetical protein